MSQQCRYWMLTIPKNSYKPWNDCPEHISYVKGQLEIGQGGYEHWQILAVYKKKIRMRGVKQDFTQQAHCEPSRSAAADKYVWKEETAVAGTRFEIGEKPFKRNCKTDWDVVKQKAINGNIDDIDPQVYIQHYRTLKQIAMDHMVKPDNLDRCCGIWIYGPPGVGKSHYAREHYGNAYLKMCNKWWCGYQKEKNVLIDDLDLGHRVLGHHLKIWSDKYAFIAETKGYAVTIRPERIIVTSNYTIQQIFGDDPSLVEALERRFYRIYIPMKMF